MIKICYLLLCHKDPDAIIAQIDYLVESGGYVVYHLDKNSPKQTHETLNNYYAENENVTTVPSISAGWGDWSLVKATLRMVEQGLSQFKDASHFYHISGDCYPICSNDELVHTLKVSKKDFIETAEFYHSGWIKTGPSIERIQFYHFVNERKYKWLFYRLYDIQRLLGIKRKVPEGLKMSIGSQWWCLRRSSLQKIIDFLVLRSDVVPFFARTWIPDEIFFQTMAASVVPESERVSKPPTFLRFSDYGLPTVFYEDHFDFLLNQQRFFARKISPNAGKLKKRLVRNFLEKKTDPQIREIENDGLDNGVQTINFVANAGRNGIRFGVPIWAKFDGIERDKRVYIVISKKWHVGDRLGKALSEITSISYLGYIFDEGFAKPMDIGGFEKVAKKRRLNPVAYLRMIIDSTGENQVIIGLDPSRKAILENLSAHVADLRVIEVENEFNNQYLDGHAERTELVVAKGSSVQRSALRTAILETLKRESESLRSLDIRRYELIRDWHSAKTRSEMLGRFFERDAEDFIKVMRKIEIKD